MVTSCAKKSNATDLMNFCPTIAQMPKWASLQNWQAGQALFGASNAKEILKQDINYYLSYQVKVVKFYQKILEDLGLTWIGKLTSAESIVEIDSIEWVEEWDAASIAAGKPKDFYAVVNGKIHLKVETEMLKEEGSTEVVGKYVLETTHTLKDFKYDFAWNDSTEPHTWKTWLKDARLTADKKWSIERSYSAKAIYNDSTPTETEDDTVTYNYKNYTDNKEAIGFIVFWSYYLENVQHAAE